MHKVELAYKQNQKLDLYHTEEPGRPLVICVHGGGFVSGGKDDKRCLQSAAFLTEAGFNCASVAYSLASDKNRFGQWPRNLFDVADAVMFLQDRSNGSHYDARNFAFLGFSAGCCLSNLYMQGEKALFEELGHEVKWYRPKALVGFYGPYDFTTRQAERRSSDPHINLLHSPRYWLDRRSDTPPPVLHIQGDQDEIVYPDQHDRFRSDCRARNYPFEEIVARGFGHSFSPRDTNSQGDLLDSRLEIKRFLLQHLQ